MVAFNSEVTPIQMSSAEVFRYLSVPENYRILMPDKVRSFEATETSAKLNIEGLGDVELAITESTEYSRIEMKPQNKVPFAFDLIWEITEVSGNSCSVKAVINAKLNMMMKMMAEKMLLNFLNTQVQKLKEHMELAG